MTSIKSGLFLPAIVALMVGVFVLDLLTPLGVAVWALYAVPIILTNRFARPRSVLLATLAATVLIFVGFFFSAVGISPALSLLSRSLGTGLIWIITMVLVQQRRLNLTLSHERDLSDSILNSLPGIFYLYDEKGRFLRWNQRFESVTGLTAGEIRQRNPLDFFAGEEKDSLAELIATVFRTGQAEAEAAFVARNGGRVPFHFIGVRAEIDGNACLLGMGIDITARKQAEAQRDRLMGVLEASLNEIYIFDSETLRFEYVNECARHNLGHSMDAMRRQTPLDFLSEFTEASFQELIGPLRRHEKPKIAFEAVHRRADGSVYPVEVHLQLVDQGGQAVFLAVINDITVRKQAEATQIRLAAIVESSDDAIIGKDLNGIITDWNKGAEKTFGYSAGEVVGTSIMRLIPVEREIEEVYILGKIERGENVEQFESLRQTKDGRLINVSITASPIKDAAGKIIGASKIARDITMQKEHERELDRLTRLYAALSQINQAIVCMPTRDELFHKVCRVLVENGGFHMAWIGWHDPETRQLAPLAVSGDEDGYIRGIKVYSDDRPGGSGPSGLAFRAGHPYVCNDMLNNPVTLPWRPELLRRGFKASAVFPIRLNNEVRGTLTVYAEEPFFFQDKEVALLEEAASDVSFALDNLARDEARRQADQALRSEVHFSDTMIESMPGIVYFYDSNGRFLRWNRNFEAVSGYSRAEIALMHPRDFFAKEEQPRVEQRIEDVFAKGEASVEASFVAKDGTATPYFFTGRFALFEGKSCLVGVGVDISERKRAEEERRESEARYRKLFECAPDGIVIANPESYYIDANASLCRMLGYAREELIGLHATDIVVQTEIQHISPALDAIHKKADYHREWQFRRKSGSVFPAEVIATMMPDGNILGMIRDITERKEAEAEREKRQQAEAADRIKSAFLATMSHELRTPLNSIIGFTGIILQGLAGPLNPEQSKQLDMVRTSARHLLALVNDVLDISKIEAGQLEVAREPFDIQRSIAKVIATIAPMAEKKKLTLRVQIAPELGEAVSDERRFEQILLNLLSNAVKFTDRGEVALRAEQIDDFKFQDGTTGQAAVRLRISDMGIGIKPDDLGKLFQPFRQIDSGLSRNHDGTGLGLAICRRLTELMGGAIVAESAWGKGSTFSVTLPLKGAQRP